MAVPVNNIAVVLVDHPFTNIFSKKQPIIYLPLTFEELNISSYESNKLLYLRYNNLPWVFRLMFKHMKNIDNYYNLWSTLNSDRVCNWLKKHNLNALSDGNFNKITSPAHYLLSQCLSLEEMKLQLHMV